MDDAGGSSTDADLLASAVKLSFIDLFSGCGGLAWGFRAAGFDPAFAVEVDADAAETYRLNVDPRISICDVAKVKRWPKVRVVIGGPPCQGFSQLGSRDPQDKRN